MTLPPPSYDPGTPTDDFALYEERAARTGRLRKRWRRRHECRPPINWLWLRFGRGTTWTCPCGEEWLYDEVSPKVEGEGVRPLEHQTMNGGATWWKISDWRPEQPPLPPHRSWR
jgi:hypothetical protein